MNTILGISLIILVGVAAISIVLFTLRTGISPMPSSPDARQTMFELLNPRCSGPIYELGSGWGGVALAAARRYPECQVYGIELSPVPLLYSKMMARLLGLENIRFQRTDFMQVPLHEAGLVLCYLYPACMALLSEKLTLELKHGTPVISNTFRLPGWQPQAMRELPDLHRTRVYRYSKGEEPN